MSDYNFMWGLMIGCTVLLLAIGILVAVSAGSDWAEVE